MCIRDRYEGIISSVGGIREAVQKLHELADGYRAVSYTHLVLTIPKNSAEEVAERLVSVGIKAIWNFAHVDLKVSKEVQVENVHLSDSLMKLSYCLLYTSRCV